MLLQILLETGGESAGNGDLGDGDIKNLKLKQFKEKYGFTSRLGDPCSGIATARVSGVEISLPNCCNDAFYSQNECECRLLFANLNGDLDLPPCDDDGLGGGLGGGGTRTLKFRYVYQYLDHLGNVRLSYSDLDKSGDIDNKTEILEEHNYYPFGLKHKGYNQIVNTDNEHKFRFNDTEFDDDFDLNWYNMPLRAQDPTTGRWNGIDPVTHFSSSTYSGYNNNPVFWADPSGADWKSFWSGVKTFFGASSSGMPKGYGKVGGSGGSSVGGFLVNRTLGWAKNQALKNMFNGGGNASGVTIIYNKDTERLRIYGANYDPNKENVEVTIDDYQEGIEEYNQILIVENVFTGGQVNTETGDIDYDEPDEHGNMTHKQIPSGVYDIVTSPRKGQYRLDPVDGSRYNNQYDVPGVYNYQGRYRNGFNFHLGTNSEGCVTCDNSTQKGKRKKEWALIQRIVNAGHYSTVADNAGHPWWRRLRGKKPSLPLKVYGRMIVIGTDTHISVKFPIFLPY